MAVPNQQYKPGIIPRLFHKNSVVSTLFQH
uniref:Uncharacterized protein n=1 Tax=Siphoviridae sp. ct47y1 TaxID=2827775 RepID=A0A8S5T9I4_9CAUD|nr:MAG TPA: hypothetical protein [Siphoviridae sp. ct47y1]